MLEITQPKNSCRPGALITFSIPVLNESGNVERLIAELQKFAEEEPEYAFEFLFTDNASTDDTFEKLCRLAETEPRIRILRFSRNFGFQNSILTNFLEARGEAAIEIDADLQDPLSVAHEFLRKWESGCFVAYGVREQRNETWVTSKLRELGYFMVSSLSTFPIPRNAGDFRLIDRFIIEKIREMKQSSTPYLRGIIASIGFSQVGVPYARHRRIEGKSKFRIFTLLRLGFDGLCSTSTKPLELITILSAIIFLLSVCGMIVYFLLAVFNPELFGSGFPTIVLILLFGIAFNGICMGIIGEYIGRIFQDTRHNSLTTVEFKVEHPGWRAATSGLNEVLLKRTEGT